MQAVPIPATPRRTTRQSTRDDVRAGGQHLRGAESANAGTYADWRGVTGIMEEVKDNQRPREKAFRELHPYIALGSEFKSAIEAKQRAS